VLTDHGTLTRAGHYGGARLGNVGDVRSGSVVPAAITMVFGRAYRTAEFWAVGRAPLLGSFHQPTPMQSSVARWTSVVPRSMFGFGLSLGRV
jgi:hypothetical protein